MRKRHFVSVYNYIKWHVCTIYRADFIVCIPNETIQVDWIENFTSFLFILCQHNMNCEIYSIIQFNHPEVFDYLQFAYF